jgi:predicted RNase H-like HicB family nuclease
LGLPFSWNYRIASSPPCSNKSSVRCTVRRETVSFGNTLDEARENLAGALRDMAETNLLRGEALPVPDPARTDAQAELDESICVFLPSDAW